MKKKQQSSGSLIAAILLVALTHFFFNFSSWRTLFYTVLALALTKFILDCIELRLPKPYVVLATNEQRRETRPFSDVALHVLLFKWLRVILCDSRLYQVLLARLNEDFLSWDETFRSQGKDPETEVLRFCEKWGVDTTSWPWSKAPGEYATANEFFGRAFSAARSVESSRLGSALVASPATAVVSWFPSARELPRLLKNEAWSLDGVGVPNVKAYSNQVSSIFQIRCQSDKSPISPYALPNYFRSLSITELRAQSSPLRSFTCRPPTITGSTPRSRATWSTWSCSAWIDRR